MGAGKSTAARTFTAGLDPNLYKILYLHWMRRTGRNVVSISASAHAARVLGPKIGEIVAAYVYDSELTRSHSDLEENTQGNQGREGELRVVRSGLLYRIVSDVSDKFV